MKQYIERGKAEWLKGKEWWSQLSIREKQMTGACALFVVVFLIYQCWLSPLYSSIASLRKRITAQQKTLVWMQAADKTMMQLQREMPQSEKSTSVVMLLSHMQKDIARAGLQQQLTVLKQSTGNSIEMHFQKVEFDKLMSLMMSAIKEKSIALSHFSVQATDTPGLVNADIIFSR